MTPNPNIKLPQNNPSPKINSNPSVPISVYRQLAGELEATQSRLNMLEAENQRLTQQNRQLRQEINIILESAQHLQKFVISLDRSESQFSRTILQSKQEIAPFPRNIPNNGENNPKNSGNNQNQEILADSQTPTSDVMEIDQHTINNSLLEEKTKGMNGWFLAIAILVIVLTTFSMAFIIIRPLLNQNQR